MGGALTLCFLNSELSVETHTATRAGLGRSSCARKSWRGGRLHWHHRRLLESKELQKALVTGAPGLGRCRALALKCHQSH